MKSSIILGLALFVSLSAYADPFAVTGKEGVFVPFSNKLRGIFNDVMPFVEVEGSYTFLPNWEIWGGVGYISGKGGSLQCGQSTTIEVIPFTLGIKRFFPFTDRLDGFVGLGGLWSLYKNRDYSQSVHQHFSANTFGGVVTLGVQYHVSNKIFVRLFGEYMYQQFRFSKVYPEHFTYRHNVDMSGTKIGCGVTYSF